MKSVFTEVPPSVIEQRRRLGIDKLDELWNGEWHLVNPPKSWHGQLGRDLYDVLAPRARQRSLEPFGDAMGIFGDDSDWRVPDLVFARLEHIFEDGLTSAELVVEIRSPGDDSYRKVPFYAGRGIDEMLVIHRDRQFELYRLDGGVYQQVGGECQTLGVTFETVDGPKLRVRSDGGEAEV